tara:strand:+ start:21262 stop:25368 length:4107 start_codon:yes stop_codon:yes gene_type:complete
MPREELTISKWKGYSNVSNKRDTEDDYFVGDSKNMLATQGGSLTNTGNMQDHFVHSDFDVSGGIGLIDDESFGSLFAYKSDIGIQGKGLIASYTHQAIVSIDYLKITTTVAHNLQILSLVYITGISSAIDGIGEVISIPSTTTAIINIEYSGGAVTPSINGCFEILPMSKTQGYVSTVDWAFGTNEDYHADDSTGELVSDRGNIVIMQNNEVNIFASGGFRQDSFKLPRSIDNYGMATESTDTTYVNMEPYYYNGGLRVNDGNYFNRDNKVPMGYFYIPARTYYNITTTAGDMTTGGLWSEGTSVSDYFNTVSFSQGFSVSNDHASQQLLVYKNLPETIDATYTYSLSFDLIDSCENGDRFKDPQLNTLPYMPQVFLYNVGSPSSITETTRLSRTRIAQIGHNHLYFEPTVGAATTCIVFRTYGYTSYTIKNVQFRKTERRSTTYTSTMSPKQTGYTGGVDAGWYAAPQNIVAPSDFGALHETSYESQGPYTGGGTISGSDQAKLWDNVDYVHGSANIYPDRLVLGVEKDGSIVNSDWLFGLDDTTNGEHSYLSFAHTWVYDSMGDDGQESLLYDRGDGINAIRAGSWEAGYLHIGNAMDGHGLKIKIGFQVETPSLKRIVGSRVYITGHGAHSTTMFNGHSDVTVAPMLDDPLLLAECDFAKGVTLFDGTFSPWRNNTGDAAAQSFAWVEFAGISKFPSLTYRLKNNFKHSVSSIDARYRTSTIANGRAYIGNVLHKGESDSVARVYEDRMLISPVNKVDIFPSDSYVDVGINDGEAIIALENYNDRVLQFKTDNLYIINIAGDYIYLEKKLPGRGIKHKNAVTTCEEGIAWVNANGCFLYNGEVVRDLSEDSLERKTTEDVHSITYSKGILYMTYMKETYLDMLMYDFTTKAWYSATSGSSSLSKSSSPIPREDGGFIIVGHKSQETVNDNSIVLDHTTNEVQGAKATASIIIREWVVGSALNDTLTQLNSSGAAKRISKANEVVTETIASGVIDGDWTSTNLTTGQESPNADCDTAWSYIMRNLFQPINEGGEDEYSYDVSISTKDAMQQTSECYVNLTCRNFGTNQNASASGNSGIYGASDADLDMENATFIAPSGGITPVAGVTTYTIARDNTDAGDVFKIAYSVHNAKNEFLGVSNFSYTTVSGDNATAVATGLKNAINARSRNNYVQATSSSAVLTLTAMPIEVNDTRPADKGYYMFQEANQPLVVGQDIEKINFFTFDGSASNILSKNGAYVMETPDFDFEEPNTRKKVYKVYITYKATKSATSGSNKGPKLHYYVNGSTTKKYFKTGDNFIAGDSSGNANNRLAASDNWARAVLKPETNSQANNIYSFRLKMEGADSGIHCTNIEINDITIVYRIKSVR